MSWSKDQEKEFAGMLFLLAEMLNASVSEARVELYCRALDDLPFEQVRVAAHQHVCTSRFFPMVAELRELVQGSAEDGAEVAWAYVLKEVRRVGYTGTPVWPDDSTKHAALSLFGSWRALCQRLPADGPALLGYANQFKAAFRSFFEAKRRALATGDANGGLLTN
jgi:hypothetical protein